MSPAAEQRVPVTMVKMADTRLARALYEERIYRGMTLRQAAKAIGISLTTIFRMETRMSPPTIGNLKKAARWLGVSPGDLL